MNPSASVFVPSGRKEAPKQEEKPQEVKPQPTAKPQEVPKQEAKPQEAKKVEVKQESKEKKKKKTESWEDAAEEEHNKSAPPQTNGIKVEELSPEDLKALQELAREEGKTVEELLQEEQEEGEEVKVKEPVQAASTTSSAPVGDEENFVFTEVDDDREHVNVIFIGHVDAGKSTISGNILLLTGMVDQRTIEKYEREAKNQNRESWFLAYIMDTNEEERAKGKTVEVGRAHFETKAKRYTILDAPGHKNYVPNMIGGAAQADVGILVISARRGEFETGFHKAGQTREHAMLAKTLGVNQIIVVINKMDEPTVEWSKERYDDIQSQISTFLKGLGYPKTDVHFVPISGYKGTNIKEKVSQQECPWYDGESLLDTLDNLKPFTRPQDHPLRIPIIDRFRDRGVCTVLGKVEAGQITKGQSVLVIPNNVSSEVLWIMTSDTTSGKSAKSGENIKIGLKGVEEESLNRGFIICDPKRPVACQTKFEAQLAILELLPHKSIFSAGYNAIIHIHTAVEECTVSVILDQLNKKTGKVEKKRPQFVKNGALARCIIECSQPICLELFKDVPQLGRFTLRDEGKTIAIGKVTALGPKKKSKD